MVLDRDRYLSANIFLRCSFYYLSQVAIGNGNRLGPRVYIFLAFETRLFFCSGIRENNNFLRGAQVI